MGFLSEFRQFASQGNVVDLAVGIIIGAEFGKIVNSLVNDIVMPPIGLIIGGVDFKDLKVIIQHADPAAKVAEVSINYGLFIQTVFNFMVVAFAIFMVIKAVNRLRTGVLKEKIS